MCCDTSLRTVKDASSETDPTELWESAEDQNLADLRIEARKMVVRLLIDRSAAIVKSVLRAFNWRPGTTGQ